MEDQVSFESLPLELKIKIFSLLDEKSFLKISAVCRSWREIKERFFFTDEVILLDEPIRKKQHVVFQFFVSGLKRVVKPVPYQGSHVTFGCVKYNETAKKFQLCRENWLTPVNSVDETRELMKRAQKPFALEIYSALNTGNLTKIINEIDQMTTQIVRLNIAAACPSGIKMLEKLPKLRSLTIFDTRPSLPKLLALNGLPLVSLHLFEHCQADVLSCCHLNEFFSSTTFTHLVTLNLRKSRINDACAAIIRRNCPKLRDLEVHKAPDLSTADLLTKKGLLDFLHLPMLKFLEITFPRTEEDWLYHRKRWVRHSCDPTQTCPMGVEALLAEWDDTSPNIVDL